MTKVGIRELRQRAGELLRRVEAGETIHVTDRGRPVAMLVPLAESEPLARLRAAGEVVHAVAALGDPPAPLRLKKGPGVAVGGFWGDYGAMSADRGGRAFVNGFNRAA
jgi:prevent-host-death family protein